MIFVALAFYFVAVCNIDREICLDANLKSALWPGFIGYIAGYNVGGPYFTLEDCNDARARKPSPGEYPNFVANPWMDEAISTCYAKEIRIVVD